MGDRRRGEGARVALGLFLVQIVDLLASLGVRLGYDFPGTESAILLSVDVAVLVLFVAQAAFLFVRVTRHRNVSITRLALVYLTAATTQVVAHIALLVVSGQPRHASLLWGLWVLGGAYLMVVAVFSGWYWLYDHITPGGAFVFPENSLAGDDRPHVIDYVFISFNTNSTFGPTAEVVRSRHVKVLMMLQTVLSLAILLVFVARLVNLAKG